MAFVEPTHVLEQLGVSQGMSVADFGAGAGYYSVPAASMVGENGAVWAIDIQQDLLTKAKHIASPQQAKVLRFIHGECDVPRGSKLPDSSMDVVLVSNMLFQSDNKLGVLEEAMRVLKPNGRLLVIEWSSSFGGLGPPKEHVLSREVVRTMCAKTGFDFERELDVGDYHYGFVFRYHGS